MSVQITSKEFWAEVSAIADSVVTEYDHGVVDDIELAMSSHVTNRRWDAPRQRGKELELVEDAEELEEKVAEITRMIDNVDADDLDDVYDIIHEMVDGHEWVIYTSRAWDVAHLMRGDDNACSMFEEIGCIRSCESLDNLICRFAYCALHSNVTAEMANAVERWRVGKKADVRTIADNLRGKLCQQS